MPEPEYIQLGAMGIILIFAIKEFFSYLKSRKGNTDITANGLATQILKELQAMNNNHLNSIKEAIDRGNDKMTTAFMAHGESEHKDSMQVVELLGEIKGNLKR